MKSYLLRTNGGMDKVKPLVIATFVMLAAVVYSSEAFAWNANQLYFKGSVGQMSYDGSTSGQIDSYRYEIDDKSIGFDAGAGYSFSDNVAIEGSFFYLTEGDWTVSNAAGDSVSGKFDAYGLAATTVLRLPIGDSFGVFGKLGAYRWEVEVSTAGITVEDDGVDVLAGAGVDFRLNDSTALVAGYDHYNDVGQTAYVGVRFGL